MKNSILTITSALLLTSVLGAVNQQDQYGFIGFEGAALASGTIDITETRSSTVTLSVGSESTGYSTGVETTTETISTAVTQSGTTSSEFYTTTITSSVSVPTTTYSRTSKLLTSEPATTSTSTSTSSASSTSTSKAAAPSLAFAYGELVGMGGLIGVAAGVAALL